LNVWRLLVPIRILHVVPGAACRTSISADLASPAAGHSLGPSTKLALRKRLPSLLASRSALEKRCFSPASPTRPHPTSTIRLP